MKKILAYAATIFLVVFAQAQTMQQKDNALKFPEASHFANTRLSYKIIDAAEHTFCYDIYADDKLMIHQSSIPGLPGNEGFKTKAAAQTVAQLVIKKIKKGEMPPTVSIAEMNKLKVIKYHSPT